MTPHDLLLFDLDGTLSDPLEGIERSLNFALIDFGFSPLAGGQASAYIGPPLDQTFIQITGLEAGPDINALVAKYRERYADLGYAENEVYPGVADALAALSSQGARMAVCTSKRADFAEKILELFGLRQYFLFVDGGDIGVQKWQQIAALRSSGQVTNASLMIGDRAVDLVAAHRNALHAGGVLWGYGSPAELSQERARYLFNAPDEWARLLA